MSKETALVNGAHERWNTKAKSEVVLQLLREESIADISSEIQVPTHEIETWQRLFRRCFRSSLAFRVA